MSGPGPLPPDYSSSINEMLSQAQHGSGGGDYSGYEPPDYSHDYAEPYPGNDQAMRAMGYGSNEGPGQHKVDAPSPSGAGDIAGTWCPSRPGWAIRNQMISLK